MTTQRRRMKLKDIAPPEVRSLMPPELAEMEIPDGYENQPPLPNQITVEYEDGYVVTVDTEADGCSAIAELEKELKALQEQGE